VGEMASVSSRPSMEGRLLYMVLAPSPKAMMVLKAKEEQRILEKAEEKEKEAKNS
jgi:hypothetical protein